MNSMQHAEAEGVFRKALQIDPKSEQARECLAVLEAMKGGLDMAGGLDESSSKTV